MRPTTLSILWGGTSEPPGGLYAEPHPPTLLNFVHLLHLNQSGVQHFISDLTNTHASPLRHRHKCALDVWVDSGAENWALLIVVSSRDTHLYLWGYLLVKPK